VADSGIQRGMGDNVGLQEGEAEQEAEEEIVHCLDAPPLVAYIHFVSNT